MKRAAIIAGLIVLTVAVIFGTMVVSQKLAASPNETSCASSNYVATHRVEIKDDKLNTSHVYANLCDKLTITNLDNKARELAFGEHEQHTSYDGVEEKVLTRGESLTITLNKAGTFKFHDHLQDEVQGLFTVAPKG